MGWSNLRTHKSYKRDEGRKNSVAKKLYWKNLPEETRVELKEKLSIAQCARYASMSPEERKAYWHKIHPNGIRAKV